MSTTTSHHNQAWPTSQISKGILQLPKQLLCFVVTCQLLCGASSTESTGHQLLYNKWRGHSKVHNILSAKVGINKWIVCHAVLACGAGICVDFCKRNSFIKALTSSGLQRKPTAMSHQLIVCPPQFGTSQLTSELAGACTLTCWSGHKLADWLTEYTGHLFCVRQ